MASLHPTRVLLVSTGLALCAAGVREGLQRPDNGDSYCGQALWNGDMAQCEQLTAYGVRTGLLIALGLACLAASSRRRVLAALLVAGLGLIGVGVLRAFESPVIEMRGRTCGSVAGLGPDDGYGITSPGCADGLVEQAWLVGAFGILGVVLVAGSRPYSEALGET